MSMRNADIYNILVELINQHTETTNVEASLNKISDTKIELLLTSLDGHIYSVSTDGGVTSGFFNLSLPLFVIISFIARGARFFLLASLLKLFGSYIKKFIDDYFNLLAIVFFILLIGSFVLLKYL